MQKLVSSAFKSSWRPKHTLSSYSRPVTNNFSSLIRQNSALAENDARSQDQHETESLCEHPPRLPATQKSVPRVPAKGKNRQEPPTTVVVHHLDPAWDERYLYEQLKQFGDINGLWIKRARTGESRGIALVNFTSREAVRHLIHSRPRRPVFVDGHLLKLDWSRSQRRGQQAQWLVVLNLPDGMRPKEVVEAFAPFHPIQLELHHREELGAFGRIRFPTVALAQRAFLACKDSPLYIRGSKMHVAPDGWIPPLPGHTTVLVANIHHSASERLLRTVFAKYGTVVDAQLLSRTIPTQDLRARVRFDTASAALDAVRACDSPNGPSVLGMKLAGTLAPEQP